jgi:hydroxymethylpyrimidine/phosphomethylpyrimidine kinase
MVYMAIMSKPMNMTHDSRRRQVVLDRTTIARVEALRAAAKLASGASPSVSSLLAALVARGLDAGLNANERISA